MRPFLLAVLLGALLCLPSCVISQPEAPVSEVVTVTGHSFSDGLAALEKRTAGAAGRISAPTRKPDPSWARGALRALGTGRPPSSYSSEETRRLMAKREAVTRAWLDLGQQVERLQISGDSPVGAYSKSDPAIRRKIEEIIHRAEVVQERENPDGSYEVVLSARTDGLAAFLPPSAAPVQKQGSAAERQKGEAERNRLRQQAQETAELDARGGLLERIKSAPIGRNRLIAGAMRESPQLSANIQSLVQSAPASETRFPEPGACEVDIRFDLAKAKRLALGL